ncbi:MAG: hypothetical protein MJZ94_03160 [Bacteroidales bacterium]|nr:hypothetical protein [Candidatus Limimorpha equi]MCQ2301610.1 hypothetical protein [Bacteroidales bacterium]
MDFISGKKSKNHKSKNQKFRIQHLGVLFFHHPLIKYSTYLPVGTNKNNKNKVLLKPKFHPIEKCFSGMVFIVFCSCGMKDPQGFMPSRQIKGQARLESLDWIGLVA